MKVTITMKDPDATYDPVRDAIKAEIDAMALPDDERELLTESRIDKANAALAKWFEYGEYLTVEFDLDAMTATVLGAKE